MDQNPKIPTLKDTQKPPVKVRGLSTGLTIAERLKQFKKKDLAFILAGLGTLLMAPLAEHFMMSPESGDAASSFGSKGGGSGMFGAGGSPYEPGTNGLAPGGPVGGGSDVITPLNVRDPAALVLGLGQTQQPPAGSAAPATPPPTAPSRGDVDNIKDALAGAASRGFGGAGKPSLPVPKVALSGNNLRGLGVAGGGSTASAGVAPLSSAGLAPNHAAGSNSLSSVRAAPGFKGVARGPGMGGSGALENLKKAGADAGNVMNRGSAVAALQEAANTAIPAGGGSFGGLGQGASGTGEKAGGGNQNKDSKNLGESLAFLRAKQMQEKQLELWGKKLEANDMGLLMANIRNKSIEKAAETFTGEATKALVGMIFDPAPAPGVYQCDEESGGHMTKLPIPAGSVTRDPAGCKGGKVYYIDSKNNAHLCGQTQKDASGSATSDPRNAYVNCQYIGPKQDKDGTDGKDSKVNTSAVSLFGIEQAGKLSEVCKKIETQLAVGAGSDKSGKPAGSSGGAAIKDEAVTKYVTGMYVNARQLALALHGVYGDESYKNTCDGALKGTDKVVEAPVVPSLRNALSKVQEAIPMITGALPLSEEEGAKKLETAQSVLGVQEQGAGVWINKANDALVEIKNRVTAVNSDPNDKDRPDSLKTNEVNESLAKIKAVKDAILGGDPSKTASAAIIPHYEFVKGGLERTVAELNGNIIGKDSTFKDPPAAKMPPGPVARDVLALNKYLATSNAPKPEAPKETPDGGAPNPNPPAKATEQEAREKISAAYDRLVASEPVSKDGFMPGLYSASKQQTLPEGKDETARQAALKSRWPDANGAVGGAQSFAAGYVQSHPMVSWVNTCKDTLAAADGCNDGGLFSAKSK